ncbi:MAG: Re/Si-specific NAD(P)(+) transhydrogenase subunit alpha [Bordetella sp.]|nr:MAG: Re/Si-specific NAD(P)(+) transhydrogenase subunit alpha [Bordetella sp.]
MHIGIPREIYKQEARVAITPEVAKKYVSQKHIVIIEKDAGIMANFSNDDYVKAGAQIGKKEDSLTCELILKVHAPDDSELKIMKPNSVLVSMLSPFDSEKLERIAQTGLTAFSLESIPRITRAQGMDVLSSQANLAGYKSVLLAIHYYKRIVPMMMTAGGTLKAARVLIIGAGVAGLQAIATAKRMGAIVEASDVRPVAKEQVESLGAKFIDVPFETDNEREIAQGKGGYAQIMPSSWIKRQLMLVSERCKSSDIIITTALIPGKPAPNLISEETVKSMKPGSVLIDMAAEYGGNCKLTECDKVVEKYGITLVGLTNLPSMIATDSSMLYANNIFNFVKLISNKDSSLKIEHDDEIIKSCLMCSDGKLLRSN